jgi:hypothetical protein
VLDQPWRRPGERRRAGRTRRDHRRRTTRGTHQTGQPEPSHRSANVDRTPQVAD